MVAAVELPDEQGFLLTDVSWDFYERLLQEVGNRHIFVTYNRGSLEIMSPSWKHENEADLLGLFVRLLAMELDIPIKGGGSTTFRLRRVEAGLEPDRCFYIQHWASVKRKRVIDLSIDPPPDLAIEVEVSRRLADRIEVYRRLGVPELWCYGGKRLRILLLQGDQYIESERSAAFPKLLAKDMHTLLEKSLDISESQWGRFIQEWVRSEYCR